MAKKSSVQTIVAAVRKNRGGLNNASEQQILTIWRSLDEQTQKQYLDTLGERNDSHANGNAHK